MKQNNQKKYHMIKKIIIYQPLIIFVLYLSFVTGQVVNQVQIKGNKELSQQKLYSLIKSRWQANLDTLQVEKDRKIIENHYFEEGFLEATCAAIIEIDSSSNYTTIRFNITEGSLYRFGNIKIEGEQLLTKELIFRLLNIQLGERFSREKVVKSQLRAISTGLFSDVEIKMDSVDVEHKVISAIIYVNEKKRHTTNIGIGIDTEDGLKLFSEWKNRNIDRRGSGISLSSLGAVDYINDIYFKRGNLGIGFFDPFMFYLPIEWNIRLTYNSDKPKYVNFGIENYVAETSFGYNLSLLDQITLRFRIQNDRIFNATFDTEHKEFINVFRVDDNRFIGLAYEHDQRDDMVDPSAGFYFNINFEKVGGFLGGNNTFFKTIFTVQNYHTLTRLIVLANKITSGLIDSASPENIPSYLRLFMGGSGSLRGYAERSVGPKNTDGSAQGGNFLFLNNFEFRFYLSYAFNLVTFFDVGNIWLKPKLGRVNSLKYSTGLGIRWRTKFGFFRVDFGLQLNEFPNKYLNRIHFGFGQSF